MISNRSFQITSGLFFPFLLLMLLAGCAGSRYQQIESLQKQGQFEAIIESKIDCSQKSADCFRIKTALAQSYFQLQNYSRALQVSEEALDVLDGSVGLAEINRFYLLRAAIVFQQLDSLPAPQARNALSRRLESDLRYIIQTNLNASAGDRLESYLNEFNLALAQTLLDRMDYFSGKNLDILLRQLREVTEQFPPEIKNDGYGEYYSLYGELKLLKPDLDAWFHQANPSGTRENLLERLKIIYIAAIRLRNLPLYEQGYSERINRFLAEADQYMKQLVL